MTVSPFTVNQTQPVKAKDKSEFSLRPDEVLWVLAGIGLTITHFILFVQIPEFWGWLTPFAILAGLLVADFVSGFIHWAGDTWGSEETRLVGPKFIKPFRFHHSHPLDMLKSNFFVTNGDAAMSALPFLLIPFLLPLDQSWGLLAATCLWACGAWGMWTSQFHQWAHTKSPPRLVCWMQRRGIILGPQHHWRHHKAPFEVNYCITNGWCDPLLARIRFFPALEWVVSGVTGWTPRAVTKRV